MDAAITRSLPRMDTNEHEFENGDNHPVHGRYQREANALGAGREQFRPHFHATIREFDLCAFV